MTAPRSSPSGAASPVPAGLARRTWTAARAWVLAALPVKVALAAGTELSPDEAYYLGAARLDLAQPPLVDHPPLVAWLAGAGDHLPGLPLELRVRAPFVALSVALTLASVALADRRGAGPRGLGLVAMATSFGLLPMVGGFLATPDVPALLGVLAVMAWATPRGEASPEAHPILSAATGVAVALGALAKVVVLPVAIVLAAVTVGRRPAARALVLAPAALVAPWLAPSLAFQTHHAFGGGRLSLLEAAGALAGAVGVQLLLWSPWLLARGAAVARDAPRSPEAVVATTVTALVLGSALVRATPPEPNWWAPAALALVVAAASWPAEGGKQAAKGPRELADRARPAIVAWLVAPTLLAAAHALHPFLPLPRRADPTARLHGWGSAHPPLDAPGVGPYALAAERCARTRSCDDLRKYFDELNKDR